MRRLGEDRWSWSERGLFEFMFLEPEQFLMIKSRNIYFETVANPIVSLCYMMEE